MRKLLIIMGLSVLVSCQQDKNLLKFDDTSFDPGEYWEEEQEEEKKLSIFDKRLLQSQKPLNCEDLVDISLEHNPLVKEYYYLTRNKESVKDLAVGEYFPHLSGYLDGGRKRDSSVQGDQVQTDQYTEVYPEVDLKYLIFDFGGRGSRYDKAKYNWEEVSLAYNRLLQAVGKEVSNNYWSYLYTLEAYDMQKLNVSDYLELVKVTEAKLEAGTVDRGTYLQAYSQLLSNEVQLASFENEIGITLAELKKSVGLLSDHELPLVKTFPKLGKGSDDLSLYALNREALEHRSDLKADLKHEKWALAGELGAKADFFPDIYVKGSYNRPVHINSKNPSYGFEALIGIDIPIFSGFESVNNLRAWKNQVKEVKAQIASKKLNISKEVSVALDQLKKADAELKITNKLLEASENSFKISLEKFVTGINSVVDVITAQNVLADARLQNARSKKDRFVAETDLKYYIGKEEQ